MKKFLFGIVATTSLLVSSLSFAAPAAKDGFFTMVESGGAKSAAKTTMFYPHNTDIVLINETAVNLTVTTPVYATFSPTQHQHILHDYNYPSGVYISVLDQYNNLVFAGTVCQREILTFHGQPGAYSYPDRDASGC